MWRLLEEDRDLRDPLGEALARAQVERHARPAPRVDEELHGHEGLGLRRAAHARLLAVAGDLLAGERAGRVLPAHDMGVHLTSGNGSQRLQDLELLVAHGVRVHGHGRLQRDQAHDLEEVVLHHVAQDALRLEVAAAPLDAHGLGARDLHVVDEAVVPDRLEDAVREAEDEEVLDRLLPEVVVDAIDARLVEDLVQRLVEGLRRGEIPAERLLDDDARIAGAARSPEPPDHRLEQARRDGEIVERAFRAAERSAQRLERGRIAVVAAHVAKPFAKPRECRLVEPSVPLDALPGARPELLERPVRPRDTDDGDVEMPAPGHGVEGRKDLLVGEVAARPEDDEPVGARRAHLPGPFSTWPPNSNRMAESRRSWKSASPLEAKRSKSAAAST